MTNNIFKVLLPVSLLLTLAQVFFASFVPDFFDPFSMITTSLLVLSIGWFLTRNVYDHDEEIVGRRMLLAVTLSLPMLAIIFSPSYLYPYIVGKAFVFRFLGIIGFACFLYLALTNQNFKPRITPFVIGFGALAFSMFISLLFSMDISRSFWSNYERMEGYINLLSVFVLILAITSARLKEREWRRVFMVHLVVSSIIAAIAVLQKLVGVFSISVGNLPIISLCVSSGGACRVDATLGNSIYLGVYAALSFWLILYVIFSRKIQGYTLPALAFLNLLAVYFSGTRGVWAGMFLGACVLLVTRFWVQGKQKRAIQTVAAGVIFIVLFAGTIFFLKQNNIAQDVYIVQRFSSVNTLFARWTIWKMSFNAFTEKPLFGWGQENFIHAFNKYYDPALYGQETYFDHPHNTYVGWLVFGGIFGFLAFIFMLLTIFYGIFKEYYKKENQDDLVMPIVFAAIITYMTHIFFVFDNLTSTILITFMAIYFSRNVSYGSLVFPTVSTNWKRFSYIVITVITLFVIYKTIYKPSYANMSIIKAMTAAQTMPNATAIQIIDASRQGYEGALAMDTFGNYEIREFYLQKSLEYLGQLQNVQDEGTRQSIINFAQSAYNQFQKQIADNPYDHRAKFMLGLYQLNIRNYDEAISVLTKALDLAPNKQIAIIYLAKAYLLKGDVDTASRLYERAINLTPTNLGGFNQIKMEYIQVLMLANRDQKALEVIRDLVPAVNREEFNSLVSQMMQVYGLRKDLAGLIKLLGDASQLDPQNQNFTLWLAQAYVAGGNYQQAAQVINRLKDSNPSLVNEFMSQLSSFLNQQSTKSATSTAQ